MRSDIAKRETITALVGVYQQAAQEIEKAYAMLATAQSRLRSAFLDSPGYRFDTNDRNNFDRVGKKASDAILKRIKRDAWSVIVERMEFRRMLSVKRRDELDQQLEKGELPELTEENIFAMLETSVANADTYLEEAIKEVFDYLRPRRSPYKTNTEFEIGKRVILAYAVERTCGGKFRVYYRRNDFITALDNVFSLLDGKGPVKTYHGPLTDAISETTDGKGETEYFRFKCFMNGNLHLEFKRLDLLAKLNAVAGGNTLKSEI